MTDAEMLRQLIMGFHNTQLVYVAAKLGIADCLAAGPKSATELAVETGCDARSLYRALRAMAVWACWTNWPEAGSA